MAYSAPGRADELEDRLLASWNEAIEAAYASLADLGSRFFALDPGQLEQPGPATVKWFGDPAEPSFCIDAEAARTLSDWGVRGRHALHNEYCEYAVVQRPDASGRLRPKRVQVTTELREYWVCVAMAEPDALREMATQVLGSEPSWEDLYGVADPSALNGSEREVAFSHTVGGNGGHQHLLQAGVPAQPSGRLNTENALFMTHPINGLDDLIYIVLFGAHPYAVSENGGRRPATREEIFVSQGVEHLACRHADPAAAIGAQEAAWAGATVASGSDGAGARRACASGSSSGRATRTPSSSTTSSSPSAPPWSRSAAGISCSSSWRSARWWWLRQGRHPARTSSWTSTCPTPRSSAARPKCARRWPP